MAAQMTHHHFTVDEYERMVECGILTEDDRVELIAGEIIAMSPIGPLHASIVTVLTEIFMRAVPPDVVVIVQNPIRLPDDSEPQPDLALAWRADYRRAHPTPGDVLAVVEVADSTRVFDRDTKLPLYAAAGIAEAWLVDLVAGRIERHTEPGPDGYGTIVVGRRGATLTSTVVPAVHLPVDTVLGTSP